MGSNKVDRRWAATKWMGMSNKSATSKVKWMGMIIYAAGRIYPAGRIKINPDLVIR